MLVVPKSNQTKSQQEAQHEGKVEAIKVVPSSTPKPTDYSNKRKTNNWNDHDTWRFHTRVVFKRIKHKLEEDQIKVAKVTRMKNKKNRQNAIRKVFVAMVIVQMEKTTANRKMYQQHAIWYYRVKIEARRPRKSFGTGQYFTYLKYDHVQSTSKMCKVRREPRIERL